MCSKLKKICDLCVIFYLFRIHRGWTEANGPGSFQQSVSGRRRVARLVLRRLYALSVAIGHIQVCGPDDRPSECRQRRQVLAGRKVSEIADSLDYWIVLLIIRFTDTLHRPRSTKPCASGWRTAAPLSPHSGGTCRPFTRWLGRPIPDWSAAAARTRRSKVRSGAFCLYS